MEFILGTGISNKPNNLSNKFLYYAIFFIFLIFPDRIFSKESIIINSSPTTIFSFQEFVVEFTASSLKPNTLYYAKTRCGLDPSLLNKCQTFNEIDNKWLKDTDSWENFPTFGTDESGNLDGIIHARIASDSGEYMLKIRLREKGTEINLDSENYVSLKVVVLTPTPTFTLTPTPTRVPTNTPTLIPTQFFTTTDTPSSYDNIFITEFLPDPESGNEKVEIKNSNDFAVNLVNWMIDDEEGGGQAPKKFSATILPNGYYVLDLGTNSFLNNGGDTVRLLDFNGNEKDKYTYSFSTKGLSWAKDNNNNWCQQTQSFGQENSSCLSPTLTTLTSTPLPSLTPTSTPLPTPTKTTDTLETGEVLGEEVKDTELVMNESNLNLEEEENYQFPEKFLEKNSEEKSKTKNLTSKIISFLFVILGGGFIVFSIFQFFKYKKGSSN